TGHTKYVDLGQGGFAHVADHISYERQEGTDGWLDVRSPEMSWNEHLQLLIEEVQRADAHKETLNAIYAQSLPREIQFHSDFQRWRFNVRVSDPARLIAAIFDARLFASSHYASLGSVYAAETFPVAERLHAGVVNLFNDRYFDEQQARRVTEVILRHLEATIG
ncbi:MAG TPA: hypothetical protein VFV49_16055, partial [Thermoanaerobaculia bacterium]|nr:hypothetical protein [Thermoanaerobaculia bacterium]